VEEKNNKENEVEPETDNANVCDDSLGDDNAFARPRCSKTVMLLSEPAKIQVNSHYEIVHDRIDINSSSLKEYRVKISKLIK